MSRDAAFWELYKHPLWQKKRLEILGRDKFACQKCFSDDSELHIHHGYYEKGAKPWEYPDDALHTLCKECHAETTRVLKIIRQEIGSARPMYLMDLLAVVQCWRMHSRDADSVEIISEEHLDGLLLAISTSRYSPVELTFDQRREVLDKFQHIIGKTINLRALEEFLVAAVK